MKDDDLPVEAGPDRGPLSGSPVRVMVAVSTVLGAVGLLVTFWFLDVAGFDVLRERAPALDAMLLEGNRYNAYDFGKATSDIGYIVLSYGSPDLATFAFSSLLDQTPFAYPPNVTFVSFVLVVILMLITLVEGAGHRPGIGRLVFLTLSGIGVSASLCTFATELVTASGDGPEGRHTGYQFAVSIFSLALALTLAGCLARLPGVTEQVRRVAAEVAGRSRNSVLPYGVPRMLPNAPAATVAVVDSALLAAVVLAALAGTTTLRDAVNGTGAVGRYLSSVTEESVRIRIGRPAVLGNVTWQADVALFLVFLVILAASLLWLLGTLPARSPALPVLAACLCCATVAALATACLRYGLFEVSGVNPWGPLYTRVVPQAMRSGVLYGLVIGLVAALRHRRARA
ncbi:hypothetical protein [Sphaerisporangium corydalis]|uniref:DUF998 domain-containing protein n=1 Tax=Sphaerisporangium corydalis TaxID=1441875 RepID=A0ABV9EAZ0_9ACTN|nr:hypothetical protein [Sphaerisporangium corydalis]